MISQDRIRANFMRLLVCDEQWRYLSTPENPRPKGVGLPAHLSHDPITRSAQLSAATGLLELSDAEVAELRQRAKELAKEIIMSARANGAVEEASLS